MLLAITLLFVVVAESVLLVPWSNQLHEIPTYNSTDPNGTGVANSLFGSYLFTVILIALLLAAAMIGGIYIAKSEERK